MKNTSQAKNLSLYHYQSCPYCGITREALKHLNLDVEQRDTLLEPKFRQELIEGGGKTQVPCLKIEHENGTIEWLYESSDIIRYLKDSVVQKNSLEVQPA